VTDRFAVMMRPQPADGSRRSAVVIRSRDGWVWHEVCTTDHETAQEIANAMTMMQEARFGDLLSTQGGMR